MLKTVFQTDIAKERMDPMRAFMGFWTIAMLVHVAHRMHWFESPFYIAMHIGALAFLIWPRPQLFLFTVIMQLGACWAKLPSVDNHWFYVWLANIAITCAFAAELVRSRGKWNFDASQTMKNMLPILRWIVILFYICVLIHKSNTDFFDADVSCVMHFYSRISKVPYLVSIPNLSELSLLTKQLIILSIYGIFATTAIGFARRRTWFVGLTAGVTFHLMTGVLMAHFPTIAFALHFIMMPLLIQTKLIEHVDGKLQAWSGGRLTLLRLFGLYGILWTVQSIARYWILEKFGMDDFEWHYWKITLRIWLTASIIMMAWLWWIIYSNKWHQTVEKKMSATPVWLWIFPILMLINAMSPYLGLKTRTSMSMWSNIRTENNETNNFLIPNGALKFFNYQDDVVEIKDSNDRRLRRYDKDEMLIPWLKFKRRVRHVAERGDTDVYIRYERNGEIFEVKSAENDPVLTAPENILSQKLLDFREFPERGQFPCLW